MKIVRIGAMWCPACIMMNKYWNKIVGQFSDIEFIDLDLDMNEDEVQAYNPGKTLPVIIAYNDNIETKRIVGEKTMDEIINFINDARGM